MAIQFSEKNVWKTSPIDSISYANKWIQRFPCSLNTIIFFIITFNFVDDTAQNKSTVVPKLFQCADHLKYLSGPLKYLSGPRRTSYYFYRYSLTTFVDNRGAGFGISDVVYVPSISKLYCTP